MSIISNRHNVQLFNSESKAFNGQRLCKVGFKGAEKEFSSVCVSLPKMELAQVGQVGQAYKELLAEVMEEGQNKLIRALFINSGGTLKSVGDEEIGEIAVLAFLSSVSVSAGRLTKAGIAEWFKECLEENLSFIVSEKLGLPLEHPKIGMVVESYKNKFLECAAPKIALPEAQIKSLKDAIVFASSDPLSAKTGDKILARFDALEKEKEKEKEQVELLSLD